MRPGPPHASERTFLPPSRAFPLLIARVSFSPAGITESTFAFAATNLASSTRRNKLRDVYNHIVDI